MAGANAKDRRMTDHESTIPNKPSDGATDEVRLLRAGEVAPAGDQKVPSSPETDEQKRYRITQQFEDWCFYFLDPKSDTYGNKTRSAIKAYKLDPERQYNSGGVLGYENYKKLKALGSAYLDSKGITHGKLLDVAAAKLFDTKNGGGKEWWDELAIIQGIKEPEGTKPQPGGTNNTQINIYNLESKEVSDFNSKFEKFLSEQ